METKTAGRRNRKGLLMLLLSMMVGGAIGYLFSSGLVKVPADADYRPTLVYDYDILFGLLCAAAVLLAVLNLTGLSRVKRLSGEGFEGEGTSPAEKALSRTMKITMNNSVVTYLWLILSTAYALSPGAGKEQAEAFIVTNMMTALVFLVISFILYRQTMKVYNRYYPDRTMDLTLGNEKEAQKAFFEKLDEAERWIVYRSAYSAFKVTQKLLMTGILLMAVYSLFFGFQPLPIIVLAVVLLVQQTVYFREAEKYNH